MSNKEATAPLPRHNTRGGRSFTCAHALAHFQKCPFVFVWEGGAFTPTATVKFQGPTSKQSCLRDHFVGKHHQTKSRCELGLQCERIPPRHSSNRASVFRLPPPPPSWSGRKRGERGRGATSSLKMSIRLLRPLALLLLCRRLRSSHASLLSLGLPESFRDKCSPSIARMHACMRVT